MISQETGLKACLAFSHQTNLHGGDTMGAFSFLQVLQREIGPRRAGTTGEQQALDWLEAHCCELGWHTERHPFSYIGSEWYRQGLTLLLLAAGLACIWLPRPAGLILVALVFSFVMGWRKPLELRLARTQGQNLIAGLHRSLEDYVANPSRRPVLLYCAHYDTAPSMPPWLDRTRDLLRLVGPLAMLAFLGYAALEGLRLLGLLLSRVIEQTGPLTTALDRVSLWAGWIALILVAPLFVLLLVSAVARLLGRQDSPGADDNGSGVAVLLELGQRLAEDPPAGVDVCLAFWGAEEQGLFGSRQFVRRFGKSLSPEHTVVVNVDCVGVGEYLSIHAGQGTLRRRLTDPAQLIRLEAIANEHAVPTIRTWESIVSGGSSDHAEWVDRGYRLTVSLIREDYRRPSLPARILGGILRIPYLNQLELKHIHSPRDILEQIVPERLEATVAVAEDFGRQLAEELG